MKPLYITQAKYAGEYRIALTFSDGASRLVDLRGHLYGEVFEPLCSLEVFRDFRLGNWSVEWQCGADMAPEFLYNLPK